MTHGDTTRNARPASDFAKDANTESGVRCVPHGTDWNECGCWCEDDHYCSSCGEWSSGLHDVATECPWCGKAYPTDGKEAP